MTKVYDTYVPNVGPENAKIVFVGEGPGEDEERLKEPFVGVAGNVLTECIMRNGTPRESIFLANLCHYRPHQNKFEYLLNTDQLSKGVAELQEDLKRINPNVIVALGAWPLFFLTGKCNTTPAGKQTPGTGIMNWRGSIIPCTLPGLEHKKVIASLHPSFVSRFPRYLPIFDQDIKRVIEDAEYADFKLPERKLVINPSATELEGYVHELLQAEFLSVDIETFGQSLACVGFSPNPNLGICIPWNDSQRNRDAISRLCTSSIRKITHFGFFDREFLHLRGIELENWWWDTYVAQHVMWPELPNSLAYLTSIYTREPYYKYEGKEAFSDVKSWGASVSKDKLWVYNSKDACVTREIQRVQADELKEFEEWQRFFDYEMEQARGVLSDLSRAGMLIDQDRRKAFHDALLAKWATLQSHLNTLAEQDFSPKLLYVPGTDIPQYVNVDSSKQCASLLYDYLGLKPRKKRDGSITCDEDAIIGMVAEAKKEFDTKVRDDVKQKWKTILLVLKFILMIRGIRKKLSSYIDVAMSSDGRYRSLYKIGPETGRWAAEKWIDDSGCNMMTIPRDGVEI